MKYLRVPVDKLQPIVKIFKDKGFDGLLAQYVLALIWTYRKGKDGMYYSNEQIGELTDRSSSTVKRLMKAIKQEGLLDSTRRFNSSTIHKPSKKFYSLMEEKGHHDPSLPTKPTKEKGHHDPTDGSPRPPISFTKVKEEIANDVQALLRADTSLQKQWDEDTKAGYNIEYKERRIRVRAKILQLN